MAKAIMVLQAAVALHIYNSRNILTCTANVDEQILLLSSSVSK